MEIKDKKYKIKLVLLIILSIIVSFQLCWMAYWLLVINFGSQEYLNNNTDIQQERSETVSLAISVKGIPINIGVIKSGGSGARILFPKNMEGVVGVEKLQEAGYVSAAGEITSAGKKAFSKEAFDFFNSSDGAVWWKGNIGALPGKKIKTDVGGTVDNAFLDAESGSVIKLSSDQIRKIEEAADGYRVTTSAEQIEKNVTGAPVISEKTKEILGSQYAEDGKTPVWGFSGSFAENLVAGSSKIERWNPLLNEGKGGWEEVIIPDHLKKALGSTPGDMDIAVTERAPGFTELKAPNNSGGLVDVLEVSPEKFNEIKKIEGIDSYFMKGADEVDGYLPSYSKVGDIEHGFWKVTDANNNQTVTLDLFGDINPSRKVFAGTTNPDGFIFGERVSKDGKFNGYTKVDEAAKESFIIQADGTEIKYSQIAESRTREYLDGYLASIKDSPDKIAAAREQYAQILSDTKFTPEFRQSIWDSIKDIPEIAPSLLKQDEITSLWPKMVAEYGGKDLKDIPLWIPGSLRENLAAIQDTSQFSKLATEKLTVEEKASMAISLKEYEVQSELDTAILRNIKDTYTDIYPTAINPKLGQEAGLYNEEFLKAAAPLSFGEIGSGISDWAKDNLSLNALQTGIEQAADQHMDTYDTPAPTGSEKTIFGRMWDSFLESDTASQHSFFPIDSEEQYPSYKPNETPLTWGQTANLAINTASIYNPISGILMGGIAQIAIDGKKGPFDINSETYKTLTQPPAIGTVPTDPNHPLNSPEVKAIIENEKISSATPDYRSTWEQINPWGPSKEEKYVEITTEKYEQERQALEEAQQKQRELLSETSETENYSDSDEPRVFQTDDNGKLVDQYENEAPGILAAGSNNTMTDIGFSPVEQVWNQANELTSTTNSTQTTNEENNASPQNGSRMNETDSTPSWWKNVEENLFGRTDESGQRMSENEGDRASIFNFLKETENQGDFWERDENRYNGSWPFSSNNPIAQNDQPDNNPPIPSTVNEKPIPTPSSAQIPNFDNSIINNGSSGEPFDFKKNENGEMTDEAKSLMDKIYEFDPETGEVKLKEGYEEELKRQGLYKLPSKEDYLEDQEKKGKISKEQKESSLKKDKDITVPDGTTVQDNKNRTYTADENPDKNNPSETKNKINPEDISVVIK